MAFSLPAPFPWLYLCPVLKPFVKLKYSVVSLVAIRCVPSGGSEEGRSIGADPPPHLCLHLCREPTSPLDSTYPIPGSKYVGGYMGVGL